MSFTEGIDDMKTPDWSEGKGMSKHPPIRLQPVSGMSCGPTAICCISGASPDRVVIAMMKAAAEDGEQPDHLADSNFRHQARALELLGWQLFDDTGTQIAARSVPWPVKATDDLNRWPTIPDFLQENKKPDVLLCRAMRVRDDASEHHTFAVDASSFFDCNTGNKVVYTTGIPADLHDFRVVQALSVRRS